MDVDSSGTIHPKVTIPQRMISSFPLASFNHFFLINIANKAPLPKSKAKDIFSSIQWILSQLMTEPSGFVIDAEPIIDPKDPSSYNTLRFHNKLIKLINRRLRLPVAVYFNPSILANPEVDITERPGFSKLMSLLENSQNLIQLAVYPGVRDDRIAQSIEILEAEGVEYQLIADMSDLEVLETRMQTVEEEQWSQNGLVLYSLGNRNPMFPAGSMQIISNYY